MMFSLWELKWVMPSSLVEFFRVRKGVCFKETVCLWDMIPHCLWCMLRQEQNWRHFEENSRHFEERGMDYCSDLKYLFLSLVFLAKRYFWWIICCFC